MARGEKRAAVAAGPVEGPWELPKGWRWERLGRLISRSGAKHTPDRNSTLPFVGLEHISPHELSLNGTGRLADMRSAASAFEVGDVLYGRLRPYLNKVWLAEFAGACSGELLVLQPVGEVLGSYLALTLHDARFVAFASSAVTGDRPRLDFGQMADFVVPVPPMDVQRRIVGQIDELFADIDEGEWALECAGGQLETYRSALLRAAATGNLTADWRTNKQEPGGPATLALVLQDHRSRHAERRGRYSPPRLPSSDGLPALPEGWCWASVEAAGDVLLGRQRAPQHDSGEHPRPYLRVANVMEGRLDLRDVKVMNFTPAEFTTFALQDGDVLLNEGQAPDLIGRPAIYRGEIDGCCFQKTLLRFRAGACVEPEFALIVFRHYMRCGRFRREARITTNIGHLTQVRFLPMEFPVPPIEEQREIVARVRRAEQAVVELLKPFRANGELRQSILTAAFRGDLIA